MQPDDGYATLAGTTQEPKRGRVGQTDASEEQLRVFVDAVEDYAFITADLSGFVTGWNKGAERLLGYTASEIVGRSTSVFFTPEDRARGEAEKELETARREGRAEDERWHLRKDGSRFYGSGSMMLLREGDVLSFAKVLRDFTKQKQAQEALRASEERFRLFVENVRDCALFQVDMQGNITGWNTGAQRVFGYSESEVLSQSLEKLATAEDKAAGVLRKELERASREGRAEDERWLIRQAGEPIWCRWVTNALYDDSGQIRGFVKVLRDETERRRADEQIRSSLKEKESLLQEIHHRVKNNLQVILSLLNLQAASIEDPKARQIFEETCNRLYSIAEIHEMLYSSDDLASVDFEAYIRRLAGQLLRFYHIDAERFTFDLGAGNLCLPIGQAVPCGLILNELFVNAFKHAFPGGRKGRIRVRLQERDANMLELCVEDDGVGLPPDLDWQSANSMGLRLIRVLAEQLSGTLEKATESEGTSFAVLFPKAQFSEGDK